MSEGHGIMSTDIIPAPVRRHAKRDKTPTGPCASRGVKQNTNRTYLIDLALINKGLIFLLIGKGEGKQVYMGKFLKTIMAVAGIAALLSLPSYGGEWKQNDAGWRYEYGDGEYLKNQWEWIDGKCYYFGESGYLFTNAAAPDGSVVNDKGEWTVNGVVQTKDDGEADDPYPLRGRIDNNFVQGSDGTTGWKWDDMYIPWELKKDGAGQYIMDCAIRDKNPMYLTSYRNLDLAVLAELAGYPAIGLDYVDQNKKEKMVQEVRNFLNSFDWRNASDYEKTVRIVNWIMQAEYHDGTSDDVHSPYGCLVDKLCVCDGYTSAAVLLGTCMGIPVDSMGSISHAYPVFLVDGVWLAHEPTVKDHFFTVADVYETSYTLNGVDYMFVLGEYCRGVGYEVPEDVSDKFPDVRMGWRYGDPVQMIYFK